MSCKAWKRRRSTLKPAARRLNARAKQSRRIPWWRMAMAALGYLAPAKAWVARWDAKHDEALAYSLKHGSHRVA